MDFEFVRISQKFEARGSDEKGRPEPRPRRAGDRILLARVPLVHGSCGVAGAKLWGTWIVGNKSLGNGAWPAHSRCQIYDNKNEVRVSAHRFSLSLSLFPLGGNRGADRMMMRFTSPRCFEENLLDTRAFFMHILWLQNIFVPHWLDCHSLIFWHII